MTRRRGRQRCARGTIRVREFAHILFYYRDQADFRSPAYEGTLQYSEGFENAVNYLAQRGSLPTFCEALGFTPDTFRDVTGIAVPKGSSRWFWVDAIASTISLVLEKLPRCRSFSMTLARPLGARESAALDSLRQQSHGARDSGQVQLPVPAFLGTSGLRAHWQSAKEYLRATHLGCVYDLAEREGSFARR
jgi:hypothetical protein